jgi:hypothetical protein
MAGRSPVPSLRLGAEILTRAGSQEGRTERRGSALPNRAAPGRGPPSAERDPPGSPHRSARCARSDSCVAVRGADRLPPPSKGINEGCACSWSQVGRWGRSTESGHGVTPSLPTSAVSPKGITKVTRPARLRRRLCASRLQTVVRKRRLAGAGTAARTGTAARAGVRRRGRARCAARALYSSVRPLRRPGHSGAPAVPLGMGWDSKWA